MNRCSKIISLIICFVLLISQLGLEESLAIDTDSLQANSQAQPDQTEESQDQDDDSVATEANQEANEEANEEFSDEESDIQAAEFDVTENTDNNSNDSIQDQTIPEEENNSEQVPEESESEFNDEEDTEVVSEETLDEVTEEASDEDSEETSDASSDEASDEAPTEDSAEASDEIATEDKEEAIPSQDIENDKKDDSDSDKETDEEKEVLTQEATVDGIKIIVSVEEGTFPKGWTLEASKAPEAIHQQAEEAVDKVREDGRNVAEAYTFDIKVLDKEGKEIQPAEGKKVDVTFVAPENADTNVETEIYHMTDSAKKKDEHKFSAEELTQVSQDNIPAEVKENIDNPEEEITVETDGFSYYTVEFTYGDKQYVLQGGSEVSINEILKAVGLTGEVVKAETEDAPIEIREEEGVWYVGAVEAFTTTHIMKVTIKEIVYDINLGYQELERAVDLVVTDDIPTTRTITITKEWVNDDVTARPHDVEIHLENSRSILMDGPSLSLKMRALSGYPTSNPRTDNTAITAFKEATQSEYEAVASSLTSNNEIQVSGEKTYMWFNSGTIYFYSTADNIYLNANSNSIFSKMLNLHDISGAARLNTTYVTKMAFLFEDCVDLIDISPVANWDVGNVVTMRLMFGANVTDSAHDHMSYTSLEALRNWNTQSLQDAGMMFKASQGITTIEPLSGWNVSNLRNTSQMFFRAYRITTATCLSSWNVVRVGGTYYNEGNGSNATGSFSQMFGRAGDPTGATCKTTLPKFTYRAGSWSSSAGTFNPSSSPATGDAAVSAKIQDPSEYIAGDSGTAWHKSGNTWTASFTVSNDGSVWRVWEDTNNGYIDGAHGTTDSYIESSGGVVGYGSSQSNPITGVTSSATITNTCLTRKELAVTVTWSDSNDLYRDRPGFNNTTGPGGVHLTLTYGSQSKSSNSDVSTWVDNGDNTWTYTFIVYSNEDLSTFTLSEHAVPNYTQEGTPTITVTSAPGALNQTGTAAITNKHNIEILNRHSLIIANNVSGNQGSRDKYFKVDIEITNGGISTDLEVDYDEADVSIPAYPNEATTIITSPVTQPTEIETSLLGRASATFYLTSGQYLEINNMLEGTKYTITITSEDYETTSVITGRDTDQTKPADNVVADTSSGLTATTEVVFINNKHGVIPSGTNINNAGYILLSLVAMIGLTAMSLKKKFGGADHE